MPRVLFNGVSGCCAGIAHGGCCCARDCAWEGGVGNWLSGSVVSSGVDSCFCAVVVFEDSAPVFEVLYRDDSFADGFVLGVVGCEADSEFAHEEAGFLFAVDCARKREVLVEDFALFGDGGGGWGLARHELSGLAEEPGVADAAASDADGVAAGVFDHAEDLFGGPDVAGAEADAVGSRLNELSEEGPAGGADVFLFDGSAVDGDPCAAAFVRGVEDSIEVCFGFGCVVEAAAHFYGDGDVLRDGVADGLEDVDGALRFAEPVAAPGFSFDLLDGAGEVDVDGLERGVGVVSGGVALDHLVCGGGHFVGVAAHDLSGEGVVFGAAGDVVVEFAEVCFCESAAAGEECAIEQRLGDAVGASEAAGDDSHGGVGVAGESGLEEWGVEAGDGVGDAGVDLICAGEARRIKAIRAGGDARRGGCGVAALTFAPHRGEYMRVRISLVMILLLGAALAACPGCAPVLTSRGDPGPRYPESLERGETLNIQVLREDDRQTIVLTNTTARAFDAGRLWVNAWFSRPIEGLDVGETIRIPVRDMIDEHGKRMRGGGFFSTERPDPLLLAEVEADGAMYGLVVVEETTD